MAPAGEDVQDEQALNFLLRGASHQVISNRLTLSSSQCNQTKPGGGGLGIGGGGRPAKCAAAPATSFKLQEFKMQNLVLNFNFYVKTCLK